MNSALVNISCLFFLATVICIQMSMDSKQISAEREYRQVKANYEKDLSNADEIYEKLSLANNIDVRFADITYNNIDENNMDISTKIIFNSQGINVKEVKYGWVHVNDFTDTPTSDSISNWIHVENTNGYNQIIATLNNVSNQGYYYLFLKLNNREYWTPINT